MITLLSIASFLVVFSLVKKNVGLTNIVSPLIPIFYYHTIFLFLALFYVGYYEHIEISRSTIYMILYGYVSLFLSAILFGHIFDSSIVKLRCGRIAFSLSPRSSFIWSAYILQSLMLVVMILFFMKKGVLILAEDADNYRVRAREGLGAVILLFRWMSEIFVVVVALGIFCSNRFGRFSVFVFAGYFLVTIILMAGLGSRAFVLELIVIVVAIWYWASGHGVDLRLLLVGVLLFAILGLLGAYRQGLDVGMSIIFEKAVWRPFVNIQNLQWILDDFSNRAFLWGESLLIDMKTLLPGHQPNFGTWYKNEFGREFSGGSVTITYLGEAFMNLGYAGVIVAPIIIGYILAASAKIIGRGTSFLKVFLIIMLGLSMKGVVNVGVGATLIGTIFPVLFCLAMFFSLQQMLRMAGRKREG